MPVPKTGALPLGDAPAGRRPYSGEGLAWKPFSGRAGGLMGARGWRGSPSRGGPCLRVRNPPFNPVQIILPQLQGEIAALEPPRAGLRDRGHLGGAAGQEHLLEAFELLRPDRPF